MQHVDRVIKCGTVLQVVVKTSDNSEGSHKRCRDDYDHLKNKNNIFSGCYRKEPLMTLSCLSAVT